MLNRIFTSSSKPLRAPAAWALAALTILGVEAWVYAHRADMISDYWNKFLINERWAVELPWTPRVVMGNSMQKTGLDPRRISDDLTLLGVPGAKPTGIEMLLERYLDTHRRGPETLYLYIDPEDTLEQTSVILRYFASVSDALRIWGELTPYERWAFIGRYFATLDLRIMSRDAGSRPKFIGHNDYFIAFMKDGRGYMPAPHAGRSIDPDYFVRDPWRVTVGYSFPEREWKALGRVLGRCRERGIRVVLLSTIVPRTVAKAWRENGFVQKYDDLRTRIRQVYPEVAWEGPAVVAYPDGLFGDYGHLNTRGVRFYSSRFVRLHGGETGATR
ncbi:MAG: hypothetical protein MOGMAGMI_01776 [Candidatus Omnitrophica bacterium]|nr:hypothetical protein [Candidatus Omnitrophota bacterium]